MKRFCTSCGAPADADAVFCDACGKPLPARQAPELPVKNPLPSLRVSRKKVLTVGVLVTTVAIASTGGWWGWKYWHNRLDSQQASALVQQWVDSKRDELLVPACIRNFDYKVSPVRINRYDTATYDWLNDLSKIGIYEEVAENDGGSRVFKHGPKAEQFLKNGRLCFATDVKVGQVLSVGELDQETGVRLVRFNLAWTGVDAFKGLDTVKDSIPEALQQESTELYASRASGEWKLTEDVRQASRMQASQRSDADRMQVPATPGFSITTWFKGIFSSRSDAERAAQSYVEALMTSDVESALQLLDPELRNTVGDNMIRIALRMQAKGQAAGAVSKVVDIRTTSEQENVAIVSLTLDPPFAGDRQVELPMVRRNDQWFVSQPR